MTNRFTDNQLAEIYLSMYNDYTNNLNNGLTLSETHQFIYSKLFHSFNEPKSSLYNLPTEERQRVWGVYYAFLNSTPSFRHQYQTERQQQQFWNTFNTQKPQVIIINNRDRHYCAHNTVFDWLLLNSLINYNRPYVNYNRPSNYHRHDDNNKNGNFLLFLLLLVLTTLAVAATLIALYYILREFVNSAERLIFNEGQLQAAITMASIAGGAAAGALFGTFIASMPIIMFGIAAGVSNPIGLAITGIVCITILSAAAACGLTNWIQNKVIQHNNKDALDPKDPYRYTLTASEEANLVKKGYDIYAVKIAIVALREKIGAKEVPSLLNRLFTTSGQEKQKYLDSIRSIKKGELDFVEVDKMKFDFRLPNPYSLNSNYSNIHRHNDANYPTQQTNSFFTQPQTNYPPTYKSEYNNSPEPSAPPLDDITPTSGGLYPTLQEYQF
ncbi:hypothetical protein ACNVED_11440 [Legionella sp. D16C41]|uniref:hypothetical protein n=1 Tax=Legionella sp. D16C41 TaxID=3402688 RepID=UPI003AF7F485